MEYDENPEATVGVQSGKELTLRKGPSVWFFSFPTIPGLAIEIIVFLGLLFSGSLAWLSRKRKRWIKENWIVYEVRSGEDINVLAKRFGTSWKLLVKVNKLEPPYALRSGKKIKVPPKLP